MKIQFIGATHEVTGSCTLLEINGKNYLVDCGMEQGRDVFQNISLPVSPCDIEAVFITHAHIDHSGMVPKLYKDGFKGTVYATDVTCDLCNIMLRDSAHIQELEAERLSLIMQLEKARKNLSSLKQEALEQLMHEEEERLQRIRTDIENARADVERINAARAQLLVERDELVAEMKACGGETLPAM